MKRKGRNNMITITKATLKNLNLETLQDGFVRCSVDVEYTKKVSEESELVGQVFSYNVIYFTEF